MKKLTLLLVCLTLAGAALACDAGAASAPTLIPAQPTATPVVIDITATPSLPTLAPTQPGATSQPTAAGPTEAPTQGQASFPTPTPIVSAGVEITRVEIYLIAVGDNGQAGPMIGCQDSVVAVDRDIPPTQAPLQAALNELLSLKDEFFGQSGLRNALYNSNLAIDKVTIDDGGLATINLSGTVQLAGECDNPRFAAQIEYTAKQFPTVKDVAVFINGQAMKDFLSLK